MNRRMKLLVSGLLVSGLIIGGSVSSVTSVLAAETTNQTTSDENKQVTNTIIFKDTNNQEISRGQVSGPSVGSAITFEMVNEIRPNVNKAYDLIYNGDKTLMANGSTQVVTVIPDNFGNGYIPFYGVVKVNSKVYLSIPDDKGNMKDIGAQYYLNGGTDNEEFPPMKDGLPINTEWKVFSITAVGDNDYYYRVGNSEWISGRDATLISRTKITGENSTRKSDRSIVKTKDHISYLTRIDGQAVKNRALAANTPWYTDKMALINGVRMYRVATNEWVKASDVLSDYGYNY